MTVSQQLRERMCSQIRTYSTFYSRTSRQEMIRFEFLDLASASLTIQAPKMPPNKVKRVISTAAPRTNAVLTQQGLVMKARYSDRVKSLGDSALPFSIQVSKKISFNLNFCNFLTDDPAQLLTKGKTNSSSTHLFTDPVS